MIRIRAVLEYDGTAYRGWQRQPDAVTVQGACERALAEILGEPVDVVASGRTDTGVHARGQVVHFDHPGRIGPAELRRAWNARLPNDVWIRRLEPTAPGFHARYDAVARTYRYHVGTGPRSRSPFVRRYAWPIRGPIDWDAVESATTRVVGEHDFRSFAKGGPGTKVRPGRLPGRCVVRSARWSSSEHGRTLTITADRYLRHMVRALVGALVAVGRGRVSEGDVSAALEPGGPRTKSAYAPPVGLFLWRVEYPGEPGAAGGTPEEEPDDGPNEEG